MATGTLAAVVRHLRRAAHVDELGDLGDRELLERFVMSRNEAAFATLVRRHGAMVLGVCRRVLPQVQDAEDAFQATFLVLARRAASVGWRDCIAGWLHEVSHRVALKARADAARRRAHERQAVLMQTSTPTCETSWCELTSLLDQELLRLPDHYRQPLVLCGLQDLTAGEAARRLGWSLRTLQRRLEQGRKLLRNRLARQGLTLSGAGLVALLPQQATAGVSPALAAATVRAAAGHLAAATAKALGLAEGIVHTVVVSRVTLMTALVMALVLAAAGTGVLVRLVLAEESVPRPGQAAPADTAETPPGGERDEAAESAIAAGLQWLVRHQAPDGHWSLNGFVQHGRCTCTGPGGANDTAGTAFGLLPLLGAGETHKDEGALHPYARNVQRGLVYLHRAQQADGSFAGGMYAHALATIAVCEAYRQTTDPWLKAPAQGALDYLIRAQHTGGGWRYAPGQAGDTSVTSWVVMALSRGRLAKLNVPAETLRGAARFLDTVAAPGGTYGYTGPGATATPTMTAAGLHSRQQLGWGRRNPDLVKGVAYLRQTPPSPALGNRYYYNYATRVMVAAGGADWQFWEPKMRKLLLDQQDRGDTIKHQKGSWSPQGDVYGAAGGRIMATSLALLTLQTCVRLDPLPARLAPRELRGEEVRALWADLAGEDFIKARHAMAVLAAAPRQVVPFLKDHLRPTPPVAAERVARLVVELDAPQFTARQKAEAELRKLGDAIEQPLRKALEAAAALEVRRRIERVLETLDQESAAPEKVQVLRGIEVLAQIPQPDARAVLEGLAGGAAGARPTLEAQRALVRQAAPK